MPVVASQLNRVGAASLSPDLSLATLLMESFHDATPLGYRSALAEWSVVSNPHCSEHIGRRIVRKESPESNLAMIEVDTDYAGFKALESHTKHMRIILLVCTSGDMEACLASHEDSPKNLMENIDWQSGPTNVEMGLFMPDAPDSMPTDVYAFRTLEHLRRGLPLLGACFALGIQPAEDQCRYSEYKCIAISHQSP